MQISHFNLYILNVTSKSKGEQGITTDFYWLVLSNHNTQRYIYNKQWNCTIILDI